MKKDLLTYFGIAALTLVSVLAGMRIATQPVEAGLGIGQRPPLVLAPKAALQSEPASFTFAPNVPPPIRRKEQRRVIVNWTIRETQAEIAPGVIYDDYWGFEGHVPGPLLRVREGDLVEIHLTNEPGATHAHNIDFHFVSGPGGGASALNVMPGQTAVLEARAMAPGLYMFHCASPDIPVHIANGMYGFVLVDPAEGMPPVDKELYVVQSEIYAHDGAQGHQKFDIDRGEKSDAQYVVFNGAVGSLLKDLSPQMKVNQTVRIYFGNAGPNLISSFHVIGQIFEKVYREGDLVSPPGHDIQTTLVPAGGSAVVEFTPRVPGAFLLVDHAIFRLHRGAAGSINVKGDKAQAAEIYNPVTAAKAPEMSADSHLDRGNMADMNHASAAKTEPSSASPAGHGPMSMDQGSMPMGNDQMGAHLVNASYTPAEGGYAARYRNIPPAVEKANGDGPTVAVSTADFPVPQPAGLQAPAGGATVVQIMAGAGVTNSTNTYSPKTITIKRGETVTWTNGDDGVLHDIVADDGGFSSGNLAPANTWAYTFSKPGRYSYYCKPHPWMKGEVIVK